jgi:hypothetical protein
MNTRRPPRGFFTVRDGRIAFQRGYWDKLSLLKLHCLPIE